MKPYIVNKHYINSTYNVGKYVNIKLNVEWHEFFMNPNNVSDTYKHTELLDTVRSDLIARFEKRPIEKYKFLLLENRYIICRWCKDNFIDKYTIVMFEIIKDRYATNFRNSPAILTNNIIDATAFKLRWL